MLKQDFVPVAFDQWFTRKQKDAEGRFYRNILKDSPRNDPNVTTQGFFLASPSGELIAFSNHRSPDRIRDVMQKALAKKVSMTAKPLVMNKPDAYFHPALPRSARVAQVNSKILDGYQPGKYARDEILQNAIGRDNLSVSYTHLTLPTIYSV